jgi:uncharacterized iron-regulated membrane protein
MIIFRYYTGVGMQDSASWLRRPQSVWLRRVLFQIHLWIGIALGLYVLAISVSGSAIVFRNEIYRVADPGPRIVEVRGEPLATEALRAAALRQHPGDTISYVWPGREPHHATEIWLDHKGRRNQRWFDPYTGEDLGPSVPYAIQITAWFMRLHTDLLAGETGRTVNGIAAALFTVLCLTGAVLWWPGVDRWKRSLWVDPRAGWKRINWDLHSALGFWGFGVVFMWAVTGIFVVWPAPVQRVIHHFSPLIQYAPPEEAPDGPRVSMAAPVFAQPGAGEFARGKRGRAPIRRSPGDHVVRWLYYLHFGNFAGNKTKAAWVVLGLLPALLFLTGAVMWWNRVVSPRFRKRAQPKA